MTPVQKRMKEFYNTIELKIDKSTFLSPEIIMNEKSGDKMILYMGDKILNKEISQSKFAIE